MPAKAVFLDRDDTLIEDPGYISKPEQVKLLPNAARSLIALKEIGYKIVIISNQSGIARGMFSEADLERIHNRLKELLAAQGAYVDQIYYCPYHPEALIEKYRKDSDCRKPNPGMILTAAQEMEIDLGASWMIGNSYCDTTAGKRAGCRTILVTTPATRQPRPNDPIPDFKAANIREAVNIIQRFQKNPLPAPPGPNLKYVPAPKPAAVEGPAKPAEQKDTAAPVAPAPKTPVPPAPAAKPVGHTEELLEDVLRLLKASHREEQFADFSVSRLIAGTLQIIVIFCLLAAIWFMLTSPRNSTSTLIALGFGTVFQLMSLTCYIMHGKK